MRSKSERCGLPQAMLREERKSPVHGLIGCMNRPGPRRVPFPQKRGVFSELLRSKSERRGLPQAMLREERKSPVHGLMGCMNRPGPRRVPCSFYQKPGVKSSGKFLSYRGHGPRFPQRYFQRAASLLAFYRDGLFFPGLFPAFPLILFSLWCKIVVTKMTV